MSLEVLNPNKRVADNIVTASLGGTGLGSAASRSFPVSIWDMLDNPPQKTGVSSRRKAARTYA